MKVYLKKSNQNPVSNALAGPEYIGSNIALIEGSTVLAVGSIIIHRGQAYTVNDIKIKPLLVDMPNIYILVTPYHNSKTDTIHA